MAVRKLPPRQPLGKPVMQLRQHSITCWYDSLFCTEFLAEYSSEAAIAASASSSVCEVLREGDRWLAEASAKQRWADASPSLALAAGADGLDVVRRILAEARARLNPGGVIAIEVGHNQDLVSAAFPDLPAVWLDTEHAEGKVFLLTREDLPAI